jgi:hypothetical protein
MLARSEQIADSVEVEIVGLAGDAFRAGLVAECRLCLAPVVVRGGKPSPPGPPNR